MKQKTVDWIIIGGIILCIIACATVFLLHQGIIQPALEATPAPTENVTAEPTPELTPEPTPEPTPEITPEPTPAPIYGLSPLTESEKFLRCCDKTEIQHPSGMEKILQINGKQIAYDEKTNTCYVFQSLTTEEVKDAFQVVSKDVAAYWLVRDDGSYVQKSDAVLSGTANYIYLETDDAWSVINVVFTGLPVVSIQSEYEIGTEPADAIFMICGEDEGYSKTEKQISASIRESDSGETISVELGTNEQNSFLPVILGMGRSKGWKMYRVSPENVFRMMLAYKIWNICCSEEALKMPAKYVELVVNHEYKGLYILRPKTNDYLKNELLHPNTVVDTNEMEVADIPADLFREYRPANLSDYGLFLQTTYAYANMYDDVRMIETDDEKYYAVPGKVEYAFGTFPHRYNYLAWEYKERMITAADLHFLGNEGKLLDEEIGRRWNTAREDVLSNRAVETILTELMDELRFSGYAARNGLTVAYGDAGNLWIDDAAAYGDLLESQKKLLYNSFSLRSNNLDSAMAPFADDSDVDTEILREVESAAVRKNGTIDPEEGYYTDEKKMSDYQGFQDIYLEWTSQRNGHPIKLFFDGASAYAFMPTCASTDQIHLTYDETTFDISINGRHIENNGILEGLKAGESYDLKIVYKDPADGGSHRQETDYYSLTMMKSENLPVIFVDTFNGTMGYLGTDKSRFEPGNCMCVDAGGDILAEEVIRKIHVRGSTTAGAAQRSYTFITEKATDFLGMGKADKWCLIGSGFDPTRLRNPISYSLAKDLELEYAVDYRFVDLYFNGEYHGLTLLTEQVELAENRVEPSEVQYLLKCDRLGDDAPVYMSSNRMQVFSNDEMTTEEIDNLQDEVDLRIRKINVCRTKCQYEDLKQYVDLDSFAKRYIINAITNETDSNGFSMYYLWKDNKLYAGPAWDFDRSFGNEVTWRAGDVRYSTYPNGYAETLMLNSDDFRELIKAIADEYAEAIGNVTKNLQQFRDRYQKSLQMTKKRFPWTIGGFADFGDMDNSIEYLESVNHARLELVMDTIDHPEDYCHVIAEGTIEGITEDRIIWLRKGETLTEELVQLVKQTQGWTNVTYMGGGPIHYDEPVVRDLKLTGN